MYAKVLLTTRCARPSLIRPLELADMVTHIIQSVSASEKNILTLMVICTNVINLSDNILISKYQGLITCNRLTPLHKGRMRMHNARHRAELSVSNSYPSCP